MKHSIFQKIIVGMLFFITIAEVVMMIVLYKSTYDSTVEDATSHIKYSASSLALVLENYDPDDPSDFEGMGEYLNKMCDNLDITYLYAIKPDLENNDEIYLVTGWGKNASKEFVYKRYHGYVAKGKLKEEQIRAFKGEQEVLIHEKNQYDDTMICYTPVRRYYSSKTNAFVAETKSIVCAEVSLSSIMEEFNGRYIQLMIIMAIVTLLILVTAGLLLYFKVSKPLRFISRRMKEFVSAQDGGFFEKLPVKGNDEIAEMSDSFNIMAEEIDRFITDLSDLNRQKAELNIARQIQAGLLEPGNFENGEVDIKARMITANAVGGDLYDYCVLENGSVFVAIADVSGKGVTAALFMSRAITLLRQYAKLGYSPGETLYEYNKSLRGHNPNRMFITTFVAVYDPKTFELTYSNAGHNYPYVISDKLTKLDGKCGPAAGVFPVPKYPEYTVRMKPFDKLFMYTDGVTEAQNKEKVLLGEERLEEVLAGSAETDSEGLALNVIDMINSFVGAAEQSDDITMLTLRALPGEQGGQDEAQ